MLRWGILSTAKIGRDQVIPAIQRASNGNVTAIASRDVARARELADQVGAADAFGSYEALLARDAVDAVYIPLPHAQHVEWTIKAVEAGKHVLVEKPLALDAAAIAPVIEARDRTGRIVTEAFMVNYHPQWERVRFLISSGAIGRLRQVQGAFSYFNRDPANLRNIPALGGGGLPDIGVYPTVTTRIATGQEPGRVKARIERDPEFGTDVWASVQADFGEFELSFYCSTVMGLRQNMVFHGEKGWIEVRAPFNAIGYGHAEVILENQNHSEAKTFRFADVNQYVLQVEAVGKAAEGESSVFSLEDSVRNQRVIDAIYRAGESGGWEQV